MLSQLKNWKFTRGSAGIFVGLLSILLLNSCGLLLKRRTVANSGTESNDFDLPLLIYQSSNPASHKMVVLLSGDGGWLGFNDTLAVGFAKRGYHVIGFNSRTYFWHQRDPDQTANDLAKLINKYAAQWKIKRIVLNGYSFGADVVPFIYNRLPNELKGKVSKLQLLSPFLSTDFKVHLADLISDGDDNRAYKVKDEVDKVSIPIICFYGQDEQPKPLADVKKQNFTVTLLSGDHHYQHSYQQIIFSAGRKRKGLI